MSGVRFPQGDRPGRSIGRMLRAARPGAVGAPWHSRSRSRSVSRKLHLCGDVKAQSTKFIPGTPYVGATVVMESAPGGYRGTPEAWDPVTGWIAWADQEPSQVWTGSVATAGGVVFYGTLDRWFKAVDAKTGALLWKFRMGSGTVGQPMTYRGPDGRRYVAIVDGIGGAAGAAVSGKLDTRDPCAGLGMAGATANLPNITAMGGTLYVFALPEQGGPT